MRSSMPSRFFTLAVLGSLGFASAGLAQPANDSCAASRIVGEGTTPFSTIGATTDGPSLCLVGGGELADVWFRYTPAAGGVATVSTCGSGAYDSVLQIFTACGGAPIACNDDFCGLQSQVSFAVSAGIPVTIKVAGYFGDVTDVGLLNIALAGASLSGSGTAAPSVVGNDGAGATLLRVAVSPATAPTSTGITVVVDGSALGVGPVNLTDDGVAPDAIAGDNLFSATLVVPSGAPVGGVTLPFTVSDAQARTGTGSIGLTIQASEGACCSGMGGCVVTDRATCEAGGGVFLGQGTLCNYPAGYSVLVEPPNFENIALTGTNLGPAFGPDRDDGSATIPVGFNFPFYGGSFASVNVCTNGFIMFGGASIAFANDPALPTLAAPNGAVYGYWDDLDLRTQGSVHAQILGSPGDNLRLVIQWTNAPQFNAADSNTFQIVLFPDGSIECRYADITTPLGTDVTVGIENGAGTDALQFDGPMLGAGLRTVRFVPVPAHGACPQGRACSAVGDLLFDQIDPGMQTGQIVSQSTDCPGCLLLPASFACDDDFEIVGGLGFGSLPPRLLGRVEALVRNTGPTAPNRWRVNVYTSAMAAATSPIGDQYSEEFASPNCTIPFYSNTRYPGFTLVGFDLGRGISHTGERALPAFVPFWLSVVAVTAGPAPDVLVALSNAEAGPQGTAPNAFQARYFPTPPQTIQTNQSAAYRIRAAGPCPIDLNHDGIVDTDDLSDGIGCFFTPSCAFDYNQDGNRDPDDLSDFIGAFFNFGSTGQCG